MALNASPVVFFQYSQQTESVIINFFSGVISRMIVSNNDNGSITLLIISAWILWIMLSNIITIILDRLWYDESKYNISLDEDDEGYIIGYHGNKSWQDIIMKLQKFLSIFFIFLVIQLILQQIENAWFDLKFGTFEAIIAITIFLLCLYSINQVIEDLSKVANEMLLFLQRTQIKKEQ